MTASGSFFTVNDCGPPGLNSPALSFPSLSMSCTGVAVAPAHNACQDGGVVAENLRSPVQRCEDDAV